ncbi:MULTISPECIES: hypothetical protein [Niastella]|uniref:DUF4843 domain-containing protein n=1 Tax=Niastella soli TaxID=2821487 RepID=A0ABS3Z3B6_9BACT|nr:hypothetical protein [Niastella soli]MBO9204662.1 hypothetical protein [Niastella soli]
MKRKLFYVLPVLFFFACKDQANKEKLYNVRCDVRLFTRFFSIYINTNGNAYVIKGIGSDYADSLVVQSADTSQVFTLDSAKVFFAALDKLIAQPVFKPNGSVGTAQRGEVYYKQVKVFDDYAFDPDFWDLFRPIMGQVPKAYNPFVVDNY